MRNSNRSKSDPCNSTVTDYSSLVLYGPKNDPIGRQTPMSHGTVSVSLGGAWWLRAQNSPLSPIQISVAFEYFSKRLYTKKI